MALGRSCRCGSYTVEPWTERRRLAFFRIAKLAHLPPSVGRSNLGTTGCGRVSPGGGASPSQGGGGTGVPMSHGTITQFPLCSTPSDSHSASRKPSGTCVPSLSAPLRICIQAMPRNSLANNDATHNARGAVNVRTHKIRAKRCVMSSRQGRQGTFEHSPPGAATEHRHVERPAGTTQCG
jgi:hypothetical protein